MAKITLNHVTSGFNVSTINANFDKLQDAVNEKILFRDNPPGEPNQLETDLDVNGKRVYNVPDPVLDGEAVNLKTLSEYTQGLPDIKDYLEELVEEAEGHANDAENSANAAAASAVEAQQSADNAQISANEAAQSASQAAQSVIDATIQADRAQTEADRAEDGADLALINANVIPYKTKADRDADTTRPAGTRGWVYADPVAENNGWSVWDGATWVDAVEEAEPVVKSDLIGMQESINEVQTEVGIVSYKTSDLMRIDDPTFAFALGNENPDNASQLQVALGIRKEDGVTQITQLEAPGIPQEIANDPIWAVAYYNENNQLIRGVTQTGEVFETLNGVWTQINSGGTDTIVSEGLTPLAKMLRRCMNPLQDAVIVTIGDSITWGSGATNTGPTSPRDHRLTDVRANLTCRSWVNQFREYLGRNYLNIDENASPVEETAPGANAGGSGSYSASQVFGFAGSGYVKGYNAFGVEVNLAEVTTDIPAIASSALTVPSGGYIEMEMNAQNFDIYFQTVVDASAEFQIIFDNTVVQTVSAFNSSPSWGVSATINLPLYKPGKVKIVNTSPGTSLNFEGLIRDKIIRVINQGISGTNAVSWRPNPPSSRILLTGCCPANVTDVIIALGTNDRISTTEPNTIARFKADMSDIVQYLKNNFPGVNIQLMGGYATLEDTGKAFGQRDVAQALSEVAQKHGLGFLNLYMEMRRGIVAGENYFNLDGLHPNDTGYTKIYNILLEYSENNLAR